MYSWLHLLFIYERSAHPRILLLLEYADIILSSLEDLQLKSDIYSY